jgi:hypothetical protein
MKSPVVINRPRSEVDDLRYHGENWCAYYHGQPADIDAAQIFEEYLLEQIASRKNRKRFTAQLLKSYEPLRPKLIDRIEAEMEQHPDWSRAQIEAAVRKAAGNGDWDKNTWREAWREIDRSHF